MLVLQFLTTPQSMRKRIEAAKANLSREVHAKAEAARRAVEKSFEEKCSLVEEDFLALKIRLEQKEEDQKSCCTEAESYTRR